MMRVGLVIYGALDTLSGGYLYDRYLVQYLHQNGDDVHIVSLPWSGYLAALFQNWDNGLFRRLQQAGVDILIQDELAHPSLFHLNEKLKTRVGFPIISLVHHLRSSEVHPPSLRLFYRMVEKRYLQSVQGFIFNSHTTRKSVEVLCGRLASWACVAYPGGNAHGEGLADRQALIERSLSPGPLHILFVGNLIRRKRLDVLLRALTTLHEVDWVLDVVGRLDVEPRVVADHRRFVQRAGIAHRVRFWGACDSTQVQRLLSRGHVLVVPSEYEGFGIVYLEAMAFGLVPVATTAGAAAEIIEHGENGFLIPPGDSGALAAILAHLAQKRVFLRQMSLAARARYEQFPTWQESMETIRGFLHNVVDAASKD